MNKNIVSQDISVHQAHEVLLKLEKAGFNSNFAQRIIESRNNELAQKMMRLIEEYIIENPELEEDNFKIDSTGWKTILVQEEKYKVNLEGDVWEILVGNFKGEQLFTMDAAMRETIKAGRRMPKSWEVTKILKTKSDMPNLLLVGARSIEGLFSDQGKVAYFWQYSDNGSSWCWVLSASHDNVMSFVFIETQGLSVRCLKN